MGDWGRQPLTFAYTLHYALFDVFVSDNAGHAVNPMLWTMPIEFLGSFLVFALLLIWSGFSRPRTLLLGLFIVAAAAPSGSTANYLSCFFAGVAFADWRARGLFADLGARLAWAPWAAIGFLAVTDGTLQWLGAEQGKTAIAIALMFAVYASPPCAPSFPAGCRGRSDASLSRSTSSSFPC